MKKRWIFSRMKTSFRTRKNMKELHSDLRILMWYMMYFYDFSIIDAFRTEKEQTKAFDNGWSKASWKQSAHNYLPALAVDAVEYPIKWENKEDMANFSGAVLQAGNMLFQMGIMENRIKSGALWSRKRITDNRFVDYPHFELWEWKIIRRKGLSVAGEEIKFQEKLVKLKELLGRG